MMTLLWALVESQLIWLTLGGDNAFVNEAYVSVRAATKMHHRFEGDPKITSKEKEVKHLNFEHDDTLVVFFYRLWCHMWCYDGRHIFPLSDKDNIVSHPLDTMISISSKVGSHWIHKTNGRVAAVGWCIQILGSTIWKTPVSLAHINPSCNWCDGF